MGAAAAVAGIGAAASLAGGLMQSSAIGKGQAASIAAQQAALAQARADLEPWRTQGGNALTVTGNLSGANGPEAATTAMQDFYTSPGYQWRLDEGARAVDAGAAARGMLRSGATLKAEQAYAQGLASQEFENYYSRLNALSQQGLSAAKGAAESEVRTGEGIAQTNLSGAGGQASIYGNLASGLGNAAQSYYQNSLYDARTQALQTRPLGAVGGGYPL